MLCSVSEPQLTCFLCVAAVERRACAALDTAGQPSAKEGLSMAAARQLPGELPMGETQREISEWSRGPGVRSTSSAQASDGVPGLCA